MTKQEEKVIHSVSLSSLSPLLAGSWCSSGGGGGGGCRGMNFLCCVHNQYTTYEYHKYRERRKKPP